MLGNSLELTDDLINEFIEEYKHVWVDPEQYPKAFGFMLRSFLYQKGLLS